MKRILKSELVIAAAAVALLAGTTLASAQRAHEDAASRFQSVEENEQDIGVPPDGDIVAPARRGYSETRKGQCYFSTEQGMYGGYWGSCGERGGSPSK